MVDCSFDVEKDAYDALLMDFNGNIHVLTYLIDSINDVRKCESEVLETVQNTIIKSGIFNGGAIIDLDKRVRIYYYRH